MSTTCYVGNVESTVDEFTLKSIFANCGEVMNVRLAGCVRLSAIAKALGRWRRAMERRGDPRRSRSRWPAPPREPLLLRVERRAAPGAGPSRPAYPSLWVAKPY